MNKQNEAPFCERCGATTHFTAGSTPGSYSHLCSGSTALNKQIAGDHYKNMPIQVVEFCHANGIGFLEGNIIKYACRYSKKGGVEDVEKAKHYCELLLELLKRDKDEGN
jgi:hypothetical protein